MEEEQSWKKERDRLMADITRLTLGECSGVAKKKPSHVAPVFKTLSNSMQKKFTEQYDIYLKCKETASLTPNQTFEFVECLDEVRRNIEEKSEKMKRRYWIKKALLTKKAKKSCNIDQLSHEVFKMETEASKMQDDYDVYNNINEELKVTPAYIKMIELCERRDEICENCSLEDEIGDISFEELLEIEKKDSAFWNLLKEWTIAQ